MHHSKVFVYIIFMILLIYYKNSLSKNFFILFLYTIPESLCTKRELAKLIGLFYNVVKSVRVSIFVIMNYDILRFW